MKEEYNWASCFDELVKLGFVSDQQAQESLKRIDALQTGEMDNDQLLRYGAIGATAAPALGALANVMRGNAPIMKATRAVEPATRAAKIRTLLTGIKPTEEVPHALARSIAADATRGALGGVGLNVVRQKTDQAAELSKLKEYVRQHDANKPEEEDKPDEMHTLPIKLALSSPISRIGIVQRTGMNPGSLAKGPGINKQLGVRGPGSITAPGGANSTKMGI